MKIYGQGFVLTPQEATDLIADDPVCSEVIFRYLTGDDLYSRPDSSAPRLVIDFNDMAEASAAQYRLAFDRVTKLVKPERMLVKREALRNKWWHYGDKRPALRKAIAKYSEVLAIGLVSKIVMPVRVPTGQIFSHKIGIFASDSFGLQAVLSSSIHWTWAVKYGSSLGATVNYSASDVFDTFPLPEITERLVDSGRLLDDERRAIMLRRSLGMTKLYNLVNDPEIADDSDGDVARMRAIHSEIDAAVMDAYGWSDVVLCDGFYTYRQLARWTVSPAARGEVLDRLLEENHRRAAAESVPPKRTPTRRQGVVDGEGTLFE